MSLPATLLERFSGEFCWGTIDCVQFAAASWEWITGFNPADGFDYHSEEEARELIRRAGSLDDLVSQQIGEASDCIAEASAGDVVLSSSVSTGPILGVADPPLFWVLSERGLRPVHLDKALKVWKCRKPPQDL